MLQLVKLASAALACAMQAKNPQRKFDAMESRAPGLGLAMTISRGTWGSNSAMLTNPGKSMDSGTVQSVATKRKYRNLVEMMSRVQFAYPNMHPMPSKRLMSPSL
jgi:hypothetical protein